MLSHHPNGPRKQKDSGISVRKVPHVRFWRFYAKRLKLNIFAAFFKGLAFLKKPTNRLKSQ